MKDSTRSLSARGSSVQQDWRVWLPEEKAQIFHKHQHHLESLYCMCSVSLNEAIELKHIGLLARSLKAIGMAELCERLTHSLAVTLRAIVRSTPSITELCLMPPRWTRGIIKDKQASVRHASAGC